MIFRRLGIAGAALLCFGEGFAQAEDAHPVAQPLLGAVSHGTALAYARESDTGTLVYVAPLEGGQPAKRVSDSSLGCLPVRWHVGCGYFWPVQSLPRSHEGEAEDRDCMGEVLYRYRLADVLQGKLTAVPMSISARILTHGFAPAMPLCDIHMLDGHFEYRLRLHYDYLPVTEDKALLFVLTDGRGHLEPAGNTGDLGGYHVVVSDEEAEHPKWSLTVHGCRNTWDAKEQSWGDPRWRKEETLPVCFTEAFQALGKGGDYYFVTVSGKLYRSPKPDKDADRKMEAVWDDEKRPVVAFLTDADAERTYLFCKPDKDGKGVYFELGEKPDTQPYDAAKIPEAKADDPLPAVLAYGKILLADKKIKAKE